MPPGEQRGGIEQEEPEITRAIAYVNGGAGIRRKILQSHKRRSSEEEKASRCNGEGHPTALLFLTHQEMGRQTAVSEISR